MLCQQEMTSGGWYAFSHARASDGAFGSDMVLLGVVGAVVVAVIAYFVYRQFTRIKEMDRRIVDLEREIEDKAANPDIRTRCPRCGKVMDVPESEKLTIRFKCIKCRSVISVKNPRLKKRRGKGGKREAGE